MGSVSRFVWSLFSCHGRVVFASRSVLGSFSLGCRRGLTEGLGWVGFQSAEEYSDEAGEGGFTAKYAGAGECYVGDDEERDGVCKLFGCTVCPPPKSRNARDKVVVVCRDNG